jgi:dihydroxyacid dehydratase/phosphogluconate dehydratase
MPVPVPTHVALTAWRRVQWYDGMIALPGCDKNMPGALIAMGRLNRPALMVYGGTIKPGVSALTGQPLNIVDAFQSFGAFANDKMSEEQRRDVIRHACPGAGACGGMYTANTMASAIEALGMSLPFSSSIPAEDPLKLDECTCGLQAACSLCSSTAQCRQSATVIHCSLPLVHVYMPASRFAHCGAALQDRGQVHGAADEPEAAAARHHDALRV